MSRLRHRTRALLEALWDQFLRQTVRHDHRTMLLPGTQRCFQCIVQDMDEAPLVLILIKMWRANNWNLRPMPAEGELINLLGQDKINELTEELTKNLARMPRKMCPTCNAKTVLVNISSPREAVRLISRLPGRALFGECYSCRNKEVPFFISDFKEVLQEHGNTPNVQG